MMMPAVRWLPFLGSTVNFGSSDSATFIRNVALSHFQACIRARRVRAHRALGYQSVEQEPRVDAGDDRPCPRHALPAGDHARGSAAVDDHLFRRRVEEDVDASFAAARAIAWVIAPMPPIAWPHAPGTPAASPNR